MADTLQPRSLPGLYWDQQRNRYFPKQKISQPLSKSNIPPQTIVTNRTKPLSKSKLALIHQRPTAILASHYSNTSRCTHSTLPTFGRIKSFCATTFHGLPRRFIGDDQGWLYTSSTHWIADLNLQPQSQISSISISGDRCVATSLGPAAKISVQSLNPAGETHILSLNNLHDLWTSHLQDTTLVLGAKKKAAYLPDLDRSSVVKILHTQSDVFAVIQQHHLIYTGCRNGSILRFDKRMENQGQKLWPDRLRGTEMTSVLHLELVADWQLLSSYLNGDLMTFDLRYPRQSTPLTRYPSHKNTYTQNLGIALDPNQDFLFAAGQDRRVRGWSVQTGMPLLPPSRNLSEENVQHNPFLLEFPNVVETMQVLVEEEEMSLWAACDRNLYQFHLGQRDPRGGSVH